MPTRERTRFCGDVDDSTFRHLKLPADLHAALVATCKALSGATLIKMQGEAGATENYNGKPIIFGIIGNLFLTRLPAANQSLAPVEAELIATKQHAPGCAHRAALDLARSICLACMCHGTAEAEMGRAEHWKQNSVPRLQEMPAILNEETLRRTMEAEAVLAAKARPAAFMLAPAKHVNPKAPRSGRGPRQRRALLTLTKKQREALEVKGQCRGKLTEIAARLGISRAAAQDRIDAAEAKVERIGHAGAALRTHGRALPTDARGQAAIEDESEA